MMKKLILLFAAMFFVFAAIGCTSPATSDNAEQSGQQQKQNSSNSTGQQSSTNPDQQKPAEPASNTNNSENPVVTIEMEDGQKISVELYPSVAPNTVRNFISLVKKGFYDGLTFHRVVPGFMIQGGDPNGNGSGGPGYNIKGEFNSNGFSNNVKHERGIISMARTSMPDSAGSQFFIMVADNSGLDGQYAAFGKVQSGMDEVDKIVSVPNSGPPNNKALNPPKIKKVTIDTFGVEYDDPIKVVE